MARIEELPDDLDGALDLNAAPLNPDLERNLETASSYTSGDGSSHAKPRRNIEDVVNKTPLFMSSLDYAADEGEENIQLEAIKALQYEGTKAEIAQGFKDRGNEAVAEKHWADAREFYGKGLAVLMSKEDRWEEPTHEIKEEVKQKELEEVLRVNRARVQLELKNYRSTILDCAAALRLNPKNVKAHYRSATALMELEKFDEAIDLCKRGLDLDGSNVALQRVLDKAVAAQKQFDTRKAHRIAELHRKKQEKVTLATALKARGIMLRETENGRHPYEPEIRLDPNPLSPKSAVVFSVLLLYPMHEQSDFVKRFKETETIADHLAYIFPLPWDVQEMYRVETVDCYMDTVKGGLIKTGKRLSLLELLSNGQTEVVDGLVRIHVVPSVLAGEWISEVKAKNGM